MSKQHAGKQIELTEAIEGLRRQLEEIVASDRGDRIRFHVPKIELELQVVATRDEGGGGGIKFKIPWFGEVGGKAKVETGSQQVQTLRIELVPEIQDGTVPTQSKARFSGPARR